jgi:hypothetical protein
MFGWQPGIGDPTLLGWLSVAAYIAAAILSFRAYRLAAAPVPLTRKGILLSRVQRSFWLVTTVVLVALGINKQLDLQSLFTAIGRTLARHEGWYRNRRSIQLIFIICVAFSGALVSAGALWFYRRGGAWVHLAQLGLITLCTFVIIRAASFHHIDAMLGKKFWVFNLNHILELGGIGVVAVAALGAGWRR